MSKKEEIAVVFDGDSTTGMHDVCLQMTLNQPGVMACTGITDKRLRDLAAGFGAENVYVVQSIDDRRKYFERNNHPELMFITIDLQPDPSNTSAQIISLISGIRQDQEVICG